MYTCTKGYTRERKGIIHSTRKLDTSPLARQHYLLTQYFCCVTIQNDIMLETLHVIKVFGKHNHQLLELSVSMPSSANS